MVKDNLTNLVNNKKPVEEVREIPTYQPKYTDEEVAKLKEIFIAEQKEAIKGYQIKTSLLSPAARSKVINKSGSNYVSENREGYGPMYHGGSSSESIFSINYSFNHEDGGEKLFFEKAGEYSNKLKVSGNLRELNEELRKLENREIKVFSLVQGNYGRDREYEEKIESDLRKDIRKFEEMVRNGRVEYNGTGAEYRGRITISCHSN